MDFSLLQSGARRTGLRDTMAFNQPWVYYGMLIFDPLLRFGWVPLAIFAHHIQHSSVASFAVAFAEITRRGLWLLFRVENEHCSNISKAKASRDVPLPYSIEESKDDDRTSAEILRDAMAFSAIEARTNDVEAQFQQAYSTSTPSIESSEGSLKQRKRGLGFSISRIKTVKGFSKMLAKAHTEDFQKKKNAVKATRSDGLKRQRGVEKELQRDEELFKAESRESDSSSEERFRARRDEED